MPKVIKKRQLATSLRSTQIRRADMPIRIGFVPLVDAAPLVVAFEFGYFQAEGLEVRLERQLGWGSVFAGLAYGQLDVAHAPFPMLFALAELSQEGAQQVITRWVLNRNGNAITLSHQLKLRGATDTTSFAALARSMRPVPLSLGVASRHSMHVLILRLWLQQIGLDPNQHARFICLPPSQMIGAMEEEYIDGFCAGEPWNSLAVRSGKGWIAALSAEVLPHHPEKVLAVSSSFDRHRSGEHAALLRALARAAQDCQSPQGRSEIARLLARREYLDLDAKILSGCFPLEHDDANLTRLQFDGPNLHSLSPQECSRVASLWASHVVDVTEENLKALSRKLFLRPFPQTTKRRESPSKKL